MIVPSLAATLSAPGGIIIYTTGQIERKTGISERTIAYYNSLGLLSLKKKQGKMMVTEEDIILLMKIMIIKMTNKGLKEISHLDLKGYSLSQLIKDLENKVNDIINLVERLDRYEEEKNSQDHFPILHDLNIYIQKYYPRNQKKTNT